MNTWEQGSYVIAQVIEKETEEIVLKDFVMKKQ